MAEIKIITTETLLKDLLDQEIIDKKVLYDNINKYNLKVNKINTELTEKLREISYHPVEITINYYDYYLDNILKFYFQNKYQRTIDSLECKKKNGMYYIKPLIKIYSSSRETIYNKNILKKEKLIHFFSTNEEQDKKMLMPVYSKKKLDLPGDLENLEGYKLLSGKKLDIFYADRLKIHYKIWDNLLLIKKEINRKERDELEKFLLFIKAKREANFKIYKYTDTNKNYWQEFSEVFDLEVEFKNYHVAIRNDLKINFYGLIDDISLDYTPLIPVRIKGKYSEYFHSSYINNQLKLRYLTTFLYLTSNYDLNLFLDDIVYQTDLSVLLPLYSRKQYNKLIKLRDQIGDLILQDVKIKSLNSGNFPTKRFLEENNAMILTFLNQDYLVGKIPEEIIFGQNKTEPERLKWLQTRCIVIHPLVKGKIEQKGDIITVAHNLDIRTITLSSNEKIKNLRENWKNGDFLTLWAKFYYKFTKKLALNFWLN